MSIHEDGIDAGRALNALSNDRRLSILDWLKDPVANFPPQVDGDLVKDGVCGVFIAEKLGVSQPTASEHLRILVAAGLLKPKRIRQWTFFKRDETAIRKIKYGFYRRSEALVIAGLTRRNPLDERRADCLIPGQARDDGCGMTERLTAASPPGKLTKRGCEDMHEFRPF
ncbi:MAG: winged helix-turn-helix domain-containing protein [Parvularculaceae bacterium]